VSQLAALRAAATVYDVAALLGFKASALAYVLYGKSAQPTYKKFQIPKRGGGMREIAAPIPQLKLLQRRLADILQNCMEEIRSKYGRDDAGPRPDQVIHGFVRRRSIISNARQHRHRRFVFNADLQDFFPSINFGRVRGFFIKDSHFSLQPKVATLLAQIACTENALPQGSPCSPVISNLVGHILDVHLVRLAARHGCTYTRYADDLTFSTNERHFPTEIAALTLAKSNEWTVGIDLASLILKSGFVVNVKKSRMQFRTSRQVVTGLVVNQKINVPAEYRRTVRAMVHRLFTKGSFEMPVVVPESTATAKLVKVPGDLAKLHGMLGFIDGVDVYNRNLTPRAKDNVIDTKELMYRRFLFYKDFYATSRPVLVCEGKTDTVYLTHAIRSLASSFPQLAAVDTSGRVEIKLRRYRYAGRSTGRVLGINGGHGDLKNLLFNYRDDLKKFLAPGMKNPVLVLVDNDAAASPILSAINSISKKKSSKSDPFIHVVGNLYVVLTPLLEGGIDSTVEDFFDAATKATPYRGKSFSSSSEFDTATHFGKSDFAYNVVQPNASKISFEAFHPLLTNISAAITDHANRRL
jgi:RNA-directed DNA polymerase